MLRSEEDRTFEMLGYCYTFGVMAGEAVADLEKAGAETAVFDLI